MSQFAYKVKDGRVLRHAVFSSSKSASPLDEATAFVVWALITSEAELHLVVCNGDGQVVWSRALSLRTCDALVTACAHDRKLGTASDRPGPAVEDLDLVASVMTVDAC